MPETFNGRCQCGEVTYCVIGHSLALFACHCTECQRQSSSAFGMALWVERFRLAILSGRTQDWSRKTASGRHMVCRFCPTCGTRLFHQLTDQRDIISIKPGTLDDTTQLRPVAHIWCQSAQPWFERPPSDLAYAANPPSFSPIFARWQQVE